MLDPVNTRMFDLIILIAMLFAIMGSIVTFSLLGKVANNYRDDVLLGVKNGMPLSLKHRWDILTGDWAVIWALIIGAVAFVGLAFLKLARLSEDEGVRWLGYFGAALHSWGVLMLVLFIPIEALGVVRHLKDQRPPRRSNSDPNSG